jgi:hypothetical protein
VGDTSGEQSDARQLLLRDELFVHLLERGVSIEQRFVIAAGIRKRFRYPARPGSQLIRGAAPRCCGEQ